MITIQTNKNRRRILILDNPFDIDGAIDITADMFDAVFIIASSPHEAMMILNKVNPVSSAKCCYKPFFINKEMEGKLDDYDNLIDIYTDDFDSEDALHSAEEIIGHRQRIGLTASGDNIATANAFLIRVCRFLISRKRYDLVPEPLVGSSLGYIIPLFNLFYKLGYFPLNEYLMFYQSMQEKGYFRVVRFIHKIFHCTRCLHSHLLYIESCPRCDSSRIHSEEAIHHFRCANISPEHTYNFGGQLRCPKCHKLLRHIGIDYDRPATVYTCSDCDNNFLQPKMKVLCTNCRTEGDVTQLVAHDVNVYEITEAGRKAIVSPSVGFAVYTDFFDNYLPFDRFVNRLRLLAGQMEAGFEATGVSVVKVWVINDREETVPLTGDFISTFCRMLPGHKVSGANNMVYVKNAEYGGEADTGFMPRLRQGLTRVISTLAPGERLCFARDSISNADASAIDRFISGLSYVSPVAEGCFSADNPLPAEEEFKAIAEAAAETPHRSRPLLSRLLRRRN